MSEETAARRIKDEKPRPHARYHVRRGDILFTATPCYGMHAPWWVPRVPDQGDMPLETAPINMLDDDEWWPEVLATEGGSVRPTIYQRAVDIAARLRSPVAAEFAQQLAPAEAKLPCDVHLPPATYIRKGCPISTLMTAIGQREGLTDPLVTTFAKLEPVHLPPPTPSEARRLEDEIDRLEAGFTGHPFSDGLRRDKIDGLKAKLAGLREAGR